MGTLLPSSTQDHEKSEQQNTLHIQHQKDVDAGALFVLKSKGIIAPNLFTLLKFFIYLCMEHYIPVFFSFFLL